MVAAPYSALQYQVIADFRFKNEDYIAFGCGSKLQFIKRSSLTVSTATKNDRLETSSRSELSVASKLPTAILGIVPLPKIDLLIAYGEKYLAIFSIPKLIVGGVICVANVLPVPSTVVAVHGISTNRVRIFFGSGLIQLVRCGVGEKIQFTPYDSTRFPSDFSVTSLTLDEGKLIAYSPFEHTLSTVVFSPTGPVITKLASFYSVLKRYSLVSFRLINDRFLFVLDSLGILTIHDCALNTRLYIERICITSFAIFGRENNILVLLGDAAGYLHLYSVVLDPLHLMLKEWKFKITNARISALRVFPSDEGHLLICGDSMGHLTSLRVSSLREFNKVVPKTIFTIPMKWNAISIYSIREIPTAQNKVTECVMLDKKYSLSTFGITDSNEVVLKDKQADLMKKVAKTVLKSFTCVIAQGEKNVNFRVIDNKTQTTIDTISFESEEDIVRCFYLDPSTYAIQTSVSLVINAVVRTGSMADKSRTTSNLLRSTYLTDDIIFSHLITTQVRNPQKSRVLLGASCEKQQTWTSSIYGCLMSNQIAKINDNSENLEIKVLTKLPGRVVDCNSFADGELYVLLSPPLLIRFDIFYKDATPNVYLIATGRWSLTCVFGKVYRLLPCPEVDSNDVIVSGTKQFCTARGQTEATFLECLKGSSYKARRKHETEVIAWQINDWREWGRSVLPSGTKSWDLDVDFDRTSLRINTISSKNEDERHEFKYEQFRRPDVIQCSAPASLGSMSKMKVLTNADGKCPVKGAAVCILAGDRHGILSVLCLVERIWVIKANFHLQGEVTALDVAFHANFGFTIACGSKKSSDPTFFSILNSDMGKGNVRLYNRNESIYFVGSYQGSPMQTVQLIEKVSSLPVSAITSFYDYHTGFALLPLDENNLLSDLSISWRGESLGNTKKAKRAKTMFCSLYNKDTELTQFLTVDDKGFIRRTSDPLDNEEPVEQHPSENNRCFDADIITMKTQMSWLPCSPHTFSVVTGGFDGTVAYYFYCDEKQKFLNGAVDRVHTDSIVDTFCVTETLNDGKKYLLVLSLDCGGVVVYRKLKLTASKIISQSRPIRICTAVNGVTSLTYIPYERRIMVIGEGFELIPI